jgi:hypothetical protein
MAVRKGKETWAGDQINQRLLVYAEALDMEILQLK